ncbi:carboxypeptidase-like regulatory domain-containing protein [Aquimarina sp. D1M17]|uniref:carboxypeptidase-like regulatory domain-containing protein n=1 Tax=Aquimarina acroporae TaxID=2937283 RepID=UPI0020C09F44|nr:carboxypeptidase-like regulatory domain-containing protein [Aquimarina acroporae]MCK8523787.1 carboxypeptidase-like regulatory domain-containing protein [Aquimarina acroporae]
MGINNLSIKNYITLLLFLTHFFLYSQEQIQGIVYDKLTEKPLVGVTVYLDGTTNGTVTNTKGEFSLIINQMPSEKLIVSYLGYQTVVLDHQMILEKQYEKVFLGEQTEELGEVVLSKDTWSRRRKMRYFKKYFLGDLAIQEKCKIINEKDIKLQYNPEENVLFASASVPLKIRNKLLGYEISYTLFDFELQFTNDPENGKQRRISYVSGTSFFKELRKEPSKKHIENRASYYKGSGLHFMRALITKTLEENKFRIFDDRVAGDSFDFFKIIYQKGGLVKVELVFNKTKVIYDQKLTTQMWVPKGYFLVDKFGNHSPPNSIVYDGHMASLKIGALLPLDYALVNNLN